jgi:2-polyprenyl-3-methyl-5-hydroxy-6-metoxy-1,4-benzoquinol methylase
VIKTYTAPQGKEKLIQVACSICGSKHYRQKFISQGSAFVTCLECGMVYQNPVPVFDDLAKRYADDYFSYEFKNEENFFNLMKLGLQDIGFDRIDRSRLENARFLDIGCATGMLIGHMKEKGWTVAGVDICAESASYGIEKRGVPIHAGTLEDARFPARYFSVVHFSHLIEHVPDPKSFFLEVRRIISDNGIAVVTTPNISGFQARLLGNRWRSAIPDHLHLFSKRTLSRLLLDAGFLIEKTVTWGGIAKGVAPGIIKKPLDILAKKLGFGDVMLFVVHKSL